MGYASNLATPEDFSSNHLPFFILNTLRQNPLEESGKEDIWKDFLEQWNINNLNLESEMKRKT